MDWSDGLAKLVEVREGVSNDWVRTDVNVYPEDYGQVASILGFASENGLSVYPSGIGSNPVGPVVKANIGLVLSRLNSVLEVSSENLYVSAQAGCPMPILYAELDKHGLYLPTDYNGSLGGWAAVNAVSVRSTWYGLPRELVLGGKICTGDGVLVASGSKTTKFSSGYKIWKSLIGSLGWLGVYVELYCRVYPKPEMFVSGFGDSSLAYTLLRGGLRPVCLWVVFEAGGKEVLGVVFGGYASALRRINIPMRLSEGVSEPPTLTGNIVLVATRRGLEVEYARRALSTLRGDLAIAYVGSGVVRVSVKDFSGVEETRRLLGVPVIVERGLYDGDYWGYHPSVLRRLKHALDPKGVLSPGKFCETRS
ncbi:MAG: FAD-binding oxidoreductase [Thermoprotei archaeon]